MTEINMENINDEQQENTNLVCRWNDCLRIFPNHAALASHLSEDHVGWKKGDYFCDWNNCARQGAKCHNRFALMMHLRIHTGEKPFECTFPQCGQTFGRMDALVRHKKAEHGEGSVDNNKPTIVKPISTPLTVSQPTSFMSHSTSITKPKKIPKTSLDILSKKRPRMVGRKSRGVNNNYSSGEESDDSLVETTTTTKSSKLLTGSADYHQYRLAKAQLHYILRENEMLQDEYDLVQKKLKRMKTERRVLLQALMAKEKALSEEEEDEEDIPNDH